jgi:hypothetical protein
MHEEFTARTLWSLSNAFTSAFKQLDPVYDGHGRKRLTATGVLRSAAPATLGARLLGVRVDVCRGVGFKWLSGAKSVAKKPGTQASVNDQVAPSDPLGIFREEELHGFRDIAWQATPA